MFPQHVDVLYPLTIALAGLVGTGAFLWRAARRGVPLARAMAAGLLVTAGGVLGGRVYWLVEQGVPLGWASLLSPGYRQPGILLGMLVTALLTHRLVLPRESLRRLLDDGAPGMALAYAVGRMGCFIAGCCFGLRADVPWAVRFPDRSPAAQLHHFRNWLPDDVAGSLPVHPLQLYFAAMALVVALALLWLERRKQYDGQVVLWFVALHEGGKYLLEMLREPDLGTAANWVPTVSLVAAALAAATLLAMSLVGPGDSRRATATAGSRTAA